MARVSVVIPCYNPTPLLHQTLASVRAQTAPPDEIIVVNDGTNQPESLRVLESVSSDVTRVIDQPNQGLAAARNTGFAAASGDYVLPLDADDRIEPGFLAETAAALEAQPEAAFTYTDYRVFGDTRYVERLGDYNLHDLLDGNICIYASLIRRADWEAAGGYDGSMRLGYEDWEFWLRLAERGRYGYHLPRVLFQYRKHGRSLLTVAREHHEELVSKIRAGHPQLYSREGRVRIKARWAPAACVLGPELEVSQTIEDWQRLPIVDPQRALEQSNAEAFLITGSGATPDVHSAEWCALAVWGGKDVAELGGGVWAASRRALGGARELQNVTARTRPATAKATLPWPRRFERLHRHLVNAELTSLDAWVKHPARSLGRTIPLRVKERINRAAGRQVFDLSFYLRFQPQSVATAEAVIAPLRYMPRPSPGRRRIGLLTPHLGPGGAENVLLEIAGALDRQAQELFLIATQSQDARWRQRWEQAVDHVHDLQLLIEPERLVAAVYSIAINWEFDAVLIQNSVAGYSAIPHLRRDRPGMKILDLIHGVDVSWDFVSATAPVAGQIDLRIAISGAGRERLLQAGTPEEKIRLIRNGIDLERFRPAPTCNTGKILFAGRLDPVKRPLLLVDIAAELARLRPARDFRFVVAGDGPESAALRARAGPDPAFTLLGHTEDMPPLLAEADAVVIPSQAEGIPLVALEAFATERPVVCSRAGAAAEVVSAATGALIEPGPGEAARFAAALHALLDDPQQRIEMGRAGRRLVEAEYNRERSRRGYRELFLESQFSPQRHQDTKESD